MKAEPKTSPVKSSPTEQLQAAIQKLTSPSTVARSQTQEGSTLKKVPKNKKKKKERPAIPLPPPPPSGPPPDYLPQLAYFIPALIHVAHRGAYKPVRLSSLVVISGAKDTLLYHAPFLF